MSTGRMVLHDSFMDALLWHQIVGKFRHPFLRNFHSHFNHPFPGLATQDLRLRFCGTDTQSGLHRAIPLLCRPTPFQASSMSQWSKNTHSQTLFERDETLCHDLSQDVSETGTVDVQTDGQAQNQVLARMDSPRKARDPLHTWLTMRCSHVAVPGQPH